jgi:hypothetical protein
LDRRFGDKTPEHILADMNHIERERDELARQLHERPDARDRERLSRAGARALGLAGGAGDRFCGDLAKAAGELATRRLAAIELEALRKQKEALEVHKQLLDGAVDELRARVDELTRQEDHRNPMTALTSLDDRRGAPERGADRQRRSARPRRPSANSPTTCATGSPRGSRGGRSTTPSATCARSSAASP